MRILAIAVLVPLFAGGCVGYMTFLPRESGTFLCAQSRDELIRKRGEPSAIQSEGEVETLVYEGERHWTGVVLLAVVPVPLLLPVARDRDEVSFRGDEAVSARHQEIESGGALCGLGWPGPHSDGPFCSVR